MARIAFSGALFASFTLCIWLLINQELAWELPAVVGSRVVHGVGYGWIIKQRVFAERPSGTLKSSCLETHLRADIEGAFVGAKRFVYCARNRRQLEKLKGLIRANHMGSDEELDELDFGLEPTASGRFLGRHGTMAYDTGWNEQNDQSLGNWLVTETERLMREMGSNDPELASEIEDQLRFDSGVSTVELPRGRGSVEGGLEEFEFLFAS